MKTSLLILAVISIMMAGCVINHNEKFDRSLDANLSAKIPPLVDINAPCKTTGKVDMGCVQKINEAEARIQAIGYLQWCNENPAMCESLKEWSAILRGEMDN